MYIMHANDGRSKKKFKFEYKCIRRYLSVSGIPPSIYASLMSRRVPHAEYEMLTFPEHPDSPSLREVFVSSSSVRCIALSMAFFVILVLFFS